MMIWCVTWFDGMRLRETVVHSDIYNLANAASAQGVNAFAIVKIEQVAQ